jgi:uncharacterized membrane protein
MISALVVVALLLTGLVAGILTAGLLAVHPALRTLPVGSYISVKQAFDQNYPRIMVPLQLTSLAVSIVVTVAAAVGGHSGTASFAGLAAASIAVNIAVTVLGDLPINVAMASWQPETPPEDWQRYRARWDLFNRIRTTAAVVSLLLLSLAAVAL